MAVLRDPSGKVLGNIGDRNYIGDYPILNDYGDRVAVIEGKNSLGERPVKDAYGNLLFYISSNDPINSYLS